MKLRNFRFLVHKKFPKIPGNTKLFLGSFGNEIFREFPGINPIVHLSIWKIKTDVFKTSKSFVTYVTKIQLFIHSSLARRGTWNIRSESTKSISNCFKIQFRKKSRKNYADKIFFNWWKFFRIFIDVKAYNICKIHNFSKLN